MSAIDTRSRDVAPSSAAPVDDVPSLPLYISGLIATLCGIQAVNITIEDQNLTVSTVLLTIIGFAFSFGSRWLKLKMPLIQALCMAFVAYTLFTATGQQVSLSGLLHNAADKNTAQMTVLLAWAAVIWSWTLVTDSQVLLCCVLSLAMMGLVGSTNINQPVIIDFFIFILVATFLTIHQNFLQNRESASVQERARVPTYALTAQIALAAICGTVVMILATIVIIPAQAIFANVSLAQAIRQIAALGNASQQQNPIAAIPFSDDANFDIGTGSGFGSSPEVVMHAVASDNGGHYWRGRTYDQYTGDGWRSTFDDTKQPLERMDSGLRIRKYSVPHAALPHAQSSDLLESTIELKGGETQQFYYTGEPDTLTLNVRQDGQPYSYDDGRIDLNDQSHIQFRYTTNSIMQPDPMQADVLEKLKLTGTDYPPRIRQYYMGSLRNDFTRDSDLAYFKTAVAEALKSLPPGDQTPISKALAIRTWVANQCIYSLNVAPITPDIDHVHAFLQTTRHGYCDMFASSMAVLCRTAGLPARVATGFAPGEATGQGYDLRVEDKHAWVEVYFPEYGWLTFDPTVGTRTDGTVPTGQSSTKTGLMNFFKAMLARGPLPFILGLAIVGILAYLAKVELFDRWRSRRFVVAGPQNVRFSKSRTRIGRQYQQMTLTITRLGLPRRVSETPAEYASRAIPFLASREKALGVAMSADVVRAMTARFVAARYSRDGMAAQSEDHAFDASLDAFLRSVGRARRLQFLRRLRGIQPTAPTRSPARG